ncbi:MAG TPA: tripartite tricarboxylate transporter substrate-binding protein [Ramlibacter sp.]|nr:tripartite tricarboxylate transporter substrate-binding protein [Ramlibacter sp.]
MYKPLAAILCAMTLATPAALAQQPSVPPVVRLIVPFPSGGSTDVLARAMAPQLAARLRTNVIVENRAGGSSLIGAAAVAKGPADGSMLLFTTNSLVTAVATMRSVPFDVSKDLIPVAMVSEGPMVLGVSSKSSIKTPSDLIGAARAKPDALTFGTSGVGTFLHLATEWMNDAAGIQTRHVPYKGAAPAALDVAAGTIDFMLAAHASIVPHVQSGRVRLIGVTSRETSPAFPGLPPMASVAPGFSVDLWAIVFAPAGTPIDLVRLLNREINEIAKTRELRMLMEIEGALPVALTPEQLGSRFRDSTATWRRLAAAKSIVID